MNGPRGAVVDVQSHSFPGKTGVGPTLPLERALGEAGITIVIH